MRAVCLILATAVAVGPGEVFAQTGPEAPSDEVVLLVRARADRNAWQSAMLAQLASRGLRVRLPGALSPVVDQRPSLGRAEEAYQGLQPERALEELDSLLALLAATGGAGLGQRDIIRAHLLGALCTQAQGDLDRMHDFIDQAIRVDPGFEPSPVEYPPVFREAYQQRLEAIESRVTAVRVTGLPERALVYLDGAEVTMPIAVRKGAHLLRAEAPAHVGRGLRFIAEGEDVQLDLALEQDPEAVFRAASDLSTPLSPAVSQTAHDLGVGVIVLDVTTAGHRTSAVLSSPTEQRRVRWSGTSVVEPRTATTLLADRWTMEIRPMDASTPPGDAGESPMWPWILGGAIAVVAGAALTVLIVALSSQTQDGFTTAWSRDE